MKETIRTETARTAFVSTYADAIDSKQCLACDAMEDGVDLEGPEIILGELWHGDICRNCNREFPRARSGEDWFDACAELETPRACFDWADAVLADFEKRNGVDLETLCLNWEEATGQDTARFAHRLAMQYLGHGVGLGDDVASSSPYTPPECGWREFSAYEYADAFAALPRRQREHVTAFDGEGCAVFEDADGDAGAYAMREEGSGIGNNWAHGAGFEFYSSNAAELARIRAADTGAENRPERIWKALEQLEGKEVDG